MSSPKILAAVVLLALGAPLTAQTASYAFVGTACTGGRLLPGIGPVPFTVRGLPRVGATFEVVTESTATYPPGQRRRVMLLTGASNTSVGGLPLPVDIATFYPGQPVCGLLRTSADVTTEVPRQASHTTPASVFITIPNAPALLGTTFFQQVLSIENTTFGPPFLALSLSQGGVGTIGL